MSAGRKVKVGLKVIVSLGLIFVLVRKMDLPSLMSIMKRVDIRLLVAAGSCYFFSQAISTYRWKRLLDYPIKYGRVFSYYFTGCFFNNFLPTSIGGDVVKTYYIYQENRDLGHSMASVFLDRYVGLVALLAIATTGMVFGMDELGQTPVIWIYGMAIAGFFVASIVLWFLNWGALSRKLRVFYEPLMSYRKRKRLLFAGMLISLVIQALVVSGAYLAGLAMGIKVGIGYFALIIPLATLITMVPVSISGIGVRESAMTYLFGLIGVGMEEAVSLSVMWFVTVAAVNLIGGVEYLRIGSRMKREAE